MYFTRFKDLLKRFRDDDSGTIMVETVISLPLLVWTIAATYEFFEVHRYKSVREKASYTVADMLSREQSVVTDVYVDNTKSCSTKSPMMMASVKSVFPSSPMSKPVMNMLSAGPKCAASEA